MDGNKTKQMIENDCKNKKMRENKKKQVEQMTVTQVCDGGATM